MPVYDITIVGKAFLPDIGYPLPQPPLGIWGGSSPGVLPQPYPGQGLPGNQPYPGQGLPGNQPYPGQGLPGNQPYPDQGLPGNQPYPGQGLPGNQPYPDQGLPGNQPYPGQGLPGNQPYPSLPIYIPKPPEGGSGGGQPSQPVNTPPTDSPYWQNVFVPRVGWVWAIVPPQSTNGGGEGGSSGSEESSPSR
jgi:hypothetical protein